MSYRLEGTYLENCNCEVACPCGASNFALPATNERCDVLLAFHVDSGEIDGVDVSGKTVAMLADAPGQMADGGWRVGLFMDSSASEEQANALESVFGGQQGGPAALFAPLIGEVLGIEGAPIEFSDDGLRHSVKVGDMVDIEVEDFPAAEEGKVTTLNGVGHPAGSTLALARATRSHIDAFGMQFELAGKNGHSAPFSWQA